MAAYMTDKGTAKYLSCEWSVFARPKRASEVGSEHSMERVSIWHALSEKTSYKAGVFGSAQFIYRRHSSAPQWTDHRRNNVQNCCIFLYVTGTHGTPVLIYIYSSRYFDIDA